MRDLLSKIKRSIILAAAFLLMQAAPAAAMAPPALTKTNITFTGGQGTTLHGTVVAPAIASTTLPAMVMLSGSGVGLRTKYMKEAESFAQHGVVTLVYDKRTTGYSQTSRNYDLLAQDATAAVVKLKTVKGVDKTRVGIWGVSEGAWVAPIAAAKSNTVDYVVTVGAVGVESSQQQRWSTDERLRHQGITDSTLYLAGTPGFQFMINAGLYPLPYFSSLPYWRQVKQPVLALWGDEDQEHVPRESSLLIKQALDQGDNQRYIIDFLPDAQDQMHVTKDGGFDNLSDPAAGYIERVSAWIENIGPNMPASTFYGTPPPQVRPSQTVRSYPAYAAWPLQLAALGLFAVAFVGYPLVATIMRIKKRKRNLTPLHVPARWLSSLASVAVVGTLTYTILIFTTAGMFGQVNIGGHSVIWLSLQLATAGAVIALAVLAVKWCKRPAKAAGRALRLRFGIQAIAGFVFVLWAIYWGLFSF